MVDQTFTPINLYGTYQVDDRIHVGIGVNNPYGLGTEWDENWPGKFITTKIDLMSFFISPTIAYKINDELSVGAGFNYVTGDVKIRKFEHTFDPAAKVSIDLSGTGYGYTAGVIYKITKEISVGASYRSSVKLDAKGTANFDPPRTAYPIGDASASLELPATGFVGVAYKPIENLEVEADYQYIGWSSYDKLTIEFKANPTKNTTAPKNYRNTYILRLGGEYTMGDVQLRAGYLADRTPVKGAYVDPLLPDANRNGANLGVGYKFNEMFSVDVAYMFLKFDQRKVTGTVVNFDGTYNQSANLIGVNLLIHY
jgi:long-chain fatty acid transport protein